MNIESYTGSCHCGAVTFEVQMEGGLSNPRHCNCSLCRRKGTVMETLTADRFTLLTGNASLSVYQWNTKKAKHTSAKSVVFTPTIKGVLIRISLGSTLVVWMTSTHSALKILAWWTALLDPLLKWHAVKNNDSPDAFCSELTAYEIFT